jgi:transcriptional regulator with XRE-family HTH domain
MILEVNMTHFNPDMLSIARNFRGLSQTELIAGMGQSITQASLSKIESGDLKPSDEVIQNLSNALHFPIRFFEHIEKLNALPISLHAYRKKALPQLKH